MSSLVLPCLGIQADGHAETAPKGAMRRCEHVIADLPGVVRPRPNFELEEDRGGTHKPVSMLVSTQGEVVVVARDGASWRIEGEAGTMTGEAEPPSYDAHETSFAEARGSIFYTSKTGVRAIRTQGATTTDAAGLDLASAISPRFNVYFRDDSVVSGVDGWVAAWCWVVKRTDANGYVKRSPPSTRWVKRVYSATTFDNTLPITIADSTSGATFRFGMTSSIIAGDVIEFYRTLVVDDPTGTPAASMYLAFTYTITADDVSIGAFPTPASGVIVRIRDMRTDEELGEALYTNPEREGALLAKRGPPIASDLALWNRCMWYGRTKGPHRLTVTLLEAGSDNATAANRVLPTATGIGTFATTTNAATFTTGSAVVTGIASTVGMKVGDYVTDGGTNTPVSGGTTVPNLTTIVSVDSATQVTMSANATTTGAGTLRAYSKITIDGFSFAINQFSTLGNANDYRSVGSSTEAANTKRIEIVAGQLVDAINAAFVVNNVGVRAYHVGGAGAPIGATGGGGQIIIERVALNGASFSFVSAQTEAWTPAIGTGLTSTQEDCKNRVYYSLPDEPEAVPILNFFDIGTSDAAIQRMLPLRDALMVFKEDGLYRITGSAPNGWTVAIVDPTLRLVRPEAACVMEGTAFAFTSRGVVEIDETGVRRIVSAGAIDSEIEETKQAMLLNSAQHGCHMLPFRSWNLVLLTLPDVSKGSQAKSLDVWCYSVKTRAWTKWSSLFWRCGAYNQNTGQLFVARTDADEEVKWETNSSLNPRGYDRKHTGLSWSDVAGNSQVTITDVQRGAWKPRVGDWLVWTIFGDRDGRRILTAVDTGSGYTLTLDSGAPTAIASATDRSAYQGAPVLLEWLPSAMGTGGAVMNVWREATVQLAEQVNDGVSSTARIVFGVTDDNSTSLAEVVATPTRGPANHRPYRIGWPRNGSRRPVVAPRLSFSEADWLWRFAGLLLVGETGSEKVRR